MQPDMLCQVAVSTATYAIDKPYTYVLPASLAQRATIGMRVLIPFGQGNRRAEGILLSVGAGERGKKLKAVLALLDDEPLIHANGIQLALWMRDRYFCTVYDAIKAMLPAGLYFSLKDRYFVAEGVNRETAYAQTNSATEKKILDLLYASKDGMERGHLFAAFSDVNPGKAINRLVQKRIVVVDTTASRAVGDKHEQVAILNMPAEEAIKKLNGHTPAQRLVLQLMTDFPEVSVKDIRYYTGVATSTVKAL